MSDSDRGRSFQPVILAGGQSTRFGQDKALYRWHGRTFIDLMADAFAEVFDEADGPWVSVTRKGERPRLVEHMVGRPGVVFIEDGPSGLRGPLAGLESALACAAQATVEWCFVAACDMPAVRPRLLRAMRALAGDEGRETTAIVPRTLSAGVARLQPLHACYRVEPCLGALRTYVRGGRHSAQGFVESLSGARLLGPAELERLDPQWQLALTNVNKLSDLQIIENGE